MYSERTSLMIVSVASNNHEAVEPDIFGLYDSSKMIDRGWLTTETVVQFKLSEDPIQLWKRKYEGRKVFGLTDCLKEIRFHRESELETPPQFKITCSSKNVSHTILNLLLDIHLVWSILHIAKSYMAFHKSFPF
jgi:hypothetical protein